MAWTDELKQNVIDAYTEANPTPETSTEIIKDIAEQFEQSPNGVRMVLVQADVYVKKAAGSSSESKGKSTPKSGEGSKRVSKEDSLNALRAAIEAAGKEVDNDILEKLTGKAAVYFTQVLS